MFRLLKFAAALPSMRNCGFVKTFKTKIATTVVPTARSYMTKTSETMESRLRDQDLVPKSFRIVYRGGMDYYIQLAHHSSTLLAFFSIGVLYRTIFIEDEPVEFPIQNGLVPIDIHDWKEIAIMYGVFFFMLWGMRQISSKYVFRMYYNPETNVYRAIQIGILPMATSAHDFPASTLVRQTKRMIVPWWNGVYKANGKKIMVFGSGFKTNADYDRLFKD